MSVLDNVKEVVSLVQKVDNIELYRQILALQGEIIGVVEDNLKLREKVKDLESRLSISETLDFDGDHYWARCPDGREGPYCPTCWDIDFKLVRELRAATPGTFFCQYCVSGPKGGSPVIGSDVRGEAVAEPDHRHDHDLRTVRRRVGREPSHLIAVLCPRQQGGYPVLAADLGVWTT